VSYVPSKLPVYLQRWSAFVYILMSCFPVCVGEQTTRTCLPEWSASVCL